MGAIIVEIMEEISVILLKGGEELEELEEGEERKGLCEQIISQKARESCEEEAGKLSQMSESLDEALDLFGCSSEGY